MIARIYHPFWLWEDLGMWRRVHGKERDEIRERAVTFTGDHLAYGAAMLQVLDAYPLACEHNLTDLAQNRQAWIGHAACHLAHNMPEDIVREAWGRLTDEQRDAANAQADIAILEWERRHEEEDRGLYQQLALPGLSRRVA